MALIKCIECGKMISDQSTICVQCGAPTQISLKTPVGITSPVYYDGETMDATRVLECMRFEQDGIKRALWDMCDAAGVAEDDETISHFVSQIYDLYRQKYELEPPIIPLVIPPSQAQLNQIEFERQCAMQRQTQTSACKPHCPICGSTNLTKIGVGTRAIDGFFFGRLSVEGRAQWRCNSCNHIW